MGNYGAEHSGCAWPATVRGRRRRCCSFTDRGLRPPRGARWPGRSPATITSSGSAFRGAANPRAHRRRTCLSRQAAGCAARRPRAAARQPGRALRRPGRTGAVESQTRHCGVNMIARAPPAHARWRSWRSGSPSSLTWILLNFAKVGLSPAMCAYAKTTSGSLVETLDVGPPTLPFEPDFDGFAGAKVSSPPERRADHEVVSLSRVCHRDGVAAP